jgi:hypothetical protein
MFRKTPGFLAEGTLTETWVKKALGALRKAESALNNASESAAEAGSPGVSQDLDLAIRCVIAARKIVKKDYKGARSELREVLRSL